MIKESYFVSVFGKYLKGAIRSDQTDFDRNAAFNSFLTQVDEVFTSAEDSSEGEENNLRDSVLDYCAPLFNAEIAALDWDDIIDRLM